ncbi:sialidase family protein [Paludibaculum fermentans]|uniref:Exo-alpha-sialidase n=1 Tax=Paludibaculum fermentans TaxID=1473598 RepID=A0A7S7NQ40_PALFE|nr:sialidase family protein [Paludibaculum fermentans]QOY87722.1 exo-alpha-sialidase [Paludibaculum fermentans]
MILALLLLWSQAAAAPPGVVIDHHPGKTQQYIGSPSIAIGPGGAYVASHDFFGKGSTQSTSAVSRVFRSTDRGKTWTKTAEFSDQFWSNLFMHRGQLYLMGTTYEYGRIVIRKSVDGGVTWSAPAFLTEDTGYHTAPVPMAEKGGRLWRGFEFHPQGKWGFFEAFLISAPLKSDLMDPKSWTKTERLRYPKELAGEGDHWLEGNAIVDRKGEMLDILRVANLEKAAIVKLKGGKFEFEGLVPFPGGAKKFTIRWDKKSKRYWTLSNPALEKYERSAKDPASVRNTLALMSSPDLRHWTVERIVLSHPDVEKHAFQYVDWQFDGDDLIVASRTAFDDEEGGAPRGHDANFLTFHRVEKFRTNPK